MFYVNCKYFFKLPYGLNIDSYLENKKIINRRLYYKLILKQLINVCGDANNYSFCLGFNYSNSWLLKWSLTTSLMLWQIIQIFGNRNIYLKKLINVFSRALAPQILTFELKLNCKANVRKNSPNLGELECLFVFGLQLSNICF